jgi:HK97 family phage prohead protease
MKQREFASFGMELASVQTQGRTLTGYASVFNYPITSSMMGRKQTTFVRPTAFTRTLKNNPGQVQVLLNHGQDPQVGMKPLGVPSVMKVDGRGLYVEVPLDETSYNDDIIVSLQSGALRAMSIQFETQQEEFNADRTERYIQEVNLWEFGPVTFPANAGATASLHSLTDYLAQPVTLDDATTTGAPIRPTWVHDMHLRLADEDVDLATQRARIERFKGDR